MFYYARMWGDGSAKPEESPFRRQFEPDGAGYLYRKNLQGCGVRVSPEEYEQLIDQHARGIFKIIFLCMMVYLISMIIFVIAEINLHGTEGISASLSLLTTVAYGLWSRRKNWQGPDKMLAGRERVGLDRSPQDARMLRMALTGWTPILFCAGLIIIMCWVPLENGDLPAAHDWIWLAPLLILIVAGLAWWSVRKAQAIRICREPKSGVRFSGD